MHVPIAYPLIMITALMVGLWLTRSRQSRLRLRFDQQLAVSLGAFCGGMIGSKLPFAIFHPEGPLCGQAWLSDGKTIVFGLLGGYLGVELGKWLTDVRVKTGDAFAVPVAVAVGIGRLGCFVGGCCFGVPSSLPWAVRFADGIPRHPTQIYEAGFHWIMAAILLRLERKQLLPRQRFKFYLLTYCGYRFLTEFIRPEPRLFAGLTAYQWGVAAAVPVLLWLWRVDARPLSAASFTVSETSPLNADTSNSADKG